jgi:hypothetical protein
LEIHEADLFSVRLPLKFTIDLLSLQVVIGSDDSPLSCSRGVSRVRSNRFPYEQSILTRLVIAQFNGDHRFAASRKNHYDGEVSMCPFSRSNEKDLKSAIARKAKRVHGLISLQISEHLLVWFRLNVMIENIDVTIKAFDEIPCKVRPSSEIVGIAAPGIEQKVCFYIWMPQARWPTPTSCVLSVSRNIVAKMFPFDFDEQDEFESEQEIRTKANPRTLSPYAIQVQILDAKKAFEISFNASVKVYLKDHNALSWTHCDFSSSEVLHICLDHRCNQWMEVHREPSSAAKEFLHESCPVVFITRFEVFVESYPRGINSAQFTYILEPRLMSGNQAAKSLQFIILPRQGNMTYRLRTDGQFLSDRTGAMPVIGQAKGTNVWLSASDRCAVRPFPTIPNMASENGAIDHQMIQFVESVPGIPALAKWIAGVVTEVTDAQKSVSRSNFGFFAVLISAGKFPAPVSRVIIRSVRLFPEFSGILKTVARFAPPPGCKVIGAHDAILGLCGPPDERYERRRAQDSYFFLPLTVDWSKAVFVLQARFASARVISESGDRDALAFTGNEAIISINFQSLIPLAIHYSSSATFTADRQSGQIDGHFGLPFDYCTECRSWCKMRFAISVDDPGNPAVILFHQSPKNRVLSVAVGSVIPLRAQFAPASKLQGGQSFTEVIELGKLCQLECGESLGLGPAKQGRDAAPVHSSPSCILAWMAPALRRQLVATGSSRIARFLLEVFGGDSAGFAGLSCCHFVSMIVPAQRASLFTRTKVCGFAANGDQPFMMMTRIAFVDEPRRHSEKSSGFLFAGKRAEVFYLCGPACCRLSVGHVEFCWREWERLIPREIVGFARHNIFHEAVPVIAGLSAVM